MIRRIYINNYRCFENLDLSFQAKPSVLLIGRNGAGKSSFGNALRILQSIGRGINRVGKLIGSDDYAGLRTDAPIRFELTVELNGRVFDYSLAFELPESFHESRVREEALRLDGDVVYTRDQAEVSLGAGPSFVVDWHVVALPIIQVRGSGTPIEQFKTWLSQMVILAPIPTLMTGQSENDSLEPHYDGSNFASWFGGVLGQYPASYTVVERYLTDVLRDFQDFENKPVSETSKNLFVRFGGNGSDMPRIDFNKLSDGEKCFFLCAIVLAANKSYGPLFCMWDEPDNYLSLSEVGHLMMALRRSFENSGQLIVASHNPEAIRKFSDETTLCFNRESHLEPSTSRWLSEIGYKGDLIESLIRGDVIDGSK
jgi:energy-coupling factor transporter ATP-binding protein EcfA2